MHAILEEHEVDILQILVASILEICLWWRCLIDKCDEYCFTWSSKTVDVL